MKTETRAIVEQRRELTERIKSVLIERLDLNLQPNEITEDAPLFGMGLGLDSIDALVLIVGIEDEFNITVETTDHHIYRSINTLADFLMAMSEKATASSAVYDA